MHTLQLSFILAVIPFHNDYVFEDIQCLLWVAFDGKAKRTLHRIALAIGAKVCCTTRVL